MLNLPFLVNTCFVGFFIIIIIIIFVVIIIIISPNRTSYSNSKISLFLSALYNVS